jgi:hypothetical protein
MIGQPTTTPAVRRAPVSHHVLAGAFAAIATIAVALLVGATNPGGFWLAAGIGAMCTAYPALTLGARIFASTKAVSHPNFYESTSTVKLGPSRSKPGAVCTGGR